MATSSPLSLFGFLDCAKPHRILEPLISVTFTGCVACGILDCICKPKGRCLCLCLYFLHATGHQDHSYCPGEVRDLRELRGGHGREAPEQVPDLVCDPKVHAEGRLCGRGNLCPCFIACKTQQNAYFLIKRTQIKKCFGYKEETFLL